MPLTLYRRHARTCKQRKNRYSTTCLCPCWVQGTVEGIEIRRTLKTHDWDRAEELRAHWERKGTEPADQPQPQLGIKITIEYALTKFIGDCESRGLGPSTLSKCRRLRVRFLDFLNLSGTVAFADVDAEVCRGFRESWKLSPRTASKELERFRAFFKFCVENDWIEKNPAKSIKLPKTQNIWPPRCLVWVAMRVTGAMLAELDPLAKRRCRPSGGAATASNFLVLVLVFLS